jgi:hypothetical protein
MKVIKSSRQTIAGPKDWFTGTVYIDPVKDPDEQGVPVTWLRHVTDEEYRAAA